MKDNLSGAIWRLAVFLVVCGTATFALLAVFAQFRFEEQSSYQALFTNVGGLKSGNFVRIAGVEVGKVKSLHMQRDASVLVTFTTDQSVVLTEGSKAVIRYDNLIGGRYLALEEGAGGVKKLAAGDTIPESRTAPALDLDALIGGFKPLFRALNPDQVNALSGQLIKALQGQGATIGSFLNQTSVLTNTLADRDQLIGEVITNLDTVLATLGEENRQFDTAVDSVSQLVHGLAAHKADISTAVAYANESARTVAQLLQQSRPPLSKTVHELDRTMSLVVDDRDYFDKLLNTLPDKYQALARLGLYGDYFSFYICDLVLKVNGRNGQPVYVKLASQVTGRCAPK